MPLLRQPTAPISSAFRRMLQQAVLVVAVGAVPSVRKATRERMDVLLFPLRIQRAAGELVLDVRRASSHPWDVVLLGVVREHGVQPARASPPTAQPEVIRRNDW